MAILSELVQTIAEVEAIDPATVGLMARHIREAGLITTHGRGPAAAQMSLTDAANLLIGVNATTSAANAPRVVKAYRGLHASEFRSLSDPRPDSSWGTLGDTLEQLLNSAGRAELPEPFMGQELGLEFQEAFSSGDVHIDLTFRKSVPAAYLAMTWMPGSDVVDPTAPEQWVRTRVPEFRQIFRPLEPRGPPLKKKKPTGDRFEDTTIGYPTLRAVGKLIG